jgi:hypothetical protein
MNHFLFAFFSSLLRFLKCPPWLASVAVYRASCGREGGDWRKKKQVV